MGLFEAFDTVSHQDWIDKITADLKGKDYSDTLVWNSNEGIAVLPFYSSNSSSSTPLKKNSDWKIRETIAIQSIDHANKKALLALNGGANSLLFLGEVKGQSEMDNLLKDIQTDIIDVHFYNPNLQHTLDLTNNIKGSISYDYLGEFLITGYWNNSQENDIEEIASMTKLDSNMKSITVNGNFYGNVGYSISQQLALNLSQAVEYLNLLTEKGIDAKTVANKIQFSFSIGSNYFFEIAKLRAARKLWQLILEEFNVRDIPMSIHSETSIADFSDKDNNYNILRNTTKAMSAILGGCDSLTILAHDNSNERIDFSNRIARNIQHILKEEAFFDKVNNPADGAYFIENLTDELSKKAWQFFQDIESQGGFIACIENGFIKSELNEPQDA